MESKYARLDRFLARKLNQPLRQIKRLIASDKIIVDSQVCKDPQTLIGPFNTIESEGFVHQGLTPLYIMLHKPKGVVCATKDDQHTTVIDLIDHPNKTSLHITGRLDLNSTGLVLLTNDGRWSRLHAQPDAKVAKLYRVDVENPITDECINAFEQGIYFNYESSTTAPVQLRKLTPTCAELTLTEGKYHQIKRMFGRFRNPVLALHRFQIGSIRLPEALAEGQWRELTKAEVESLGKG